MGIEIRRRIHEFGRSVSEKCRWTVLARIGNSTAMRMTIFVPLIGMLLIFNENTEVFFKLSDRFVSDLGLDSENLFSLNSLYFTYFGLCTLGIASSLYALRCPDTISNEPNQMRYIDSIEHNATPVLAKANFQNVLNIYLDHNDADYLEGVASFEYPESLSTAFFNLMEGLHHAYSIEDSQNDDYEEAQENDRESTDDHPHDFMNGAGYFDYHKMAEAVAMNRRIDWPFTLPFRDTAPRFAKDIAFLLHKTLDYQKFYSRILIALFYIMGFALLLVPTVKTFVLLTLTLLIQDIPNTL